MKSLRPNFEREGKERVSRRSGIFIDCVWVLIDSMVKQSMSPLEWLATPWNFRGKSTIPSYSKYTVSGHKYLVLIGLSFNYTWS